MHTESPNDEIGWLVYNHEDAEAEKGTSLIRRNGPKGASHESEMSPSSLVSDYGYYNRGRMQSRNEDLHRTPDVAMSFRLQDVHGRGMIWLQASDGRDEFMVRDRAGGEKVYGAEEPRHAADRRRRPARPLARRDYSRSR